VVRKEDDGHYGKIQGKQMLNTIKLPTRICNIRTKMERRGKSEGVTLLAGRMKNIFYLLDIKVPDPLIKT
jgi:hypothetical protein